MRGYIEQINFDKSIITGWFFDPENSIGNSIELSAELGTTNIASASPVGTRPDLSKRVSNKPDLLFELRLSREIIAEDVLTQQLSVKATSAGVQFTIPLTSSLMTRLVKQLGLLLQAEGVEPTYIPGKTLAHSVKGATSGLLSPIFLPLGFESMDKSAKLGAGGHLFLTGGTNEIEKTYALSDQAAVDLQAERWRALFEKRNKECSRRNIRYIQTVLPDKLTTLRQSAPVKIDGPTPILTAIEKLMINTGFYISSAKELDKWSDQEPPFITSDSHLSATASRKVFSLLIRGYDENLSAEIESVKIDTPRYEIGDLSRRFYHLPIYSKSLEPAEIDIAKYAAGLTQSMNSPATKGHIGSRYSWRNSSAPNRSRVLVFGSSSFGHGILGRELNWWGKHFFAEHHFVWSPEFDWNVVEEVQPDIIIGQTVERFLRVLPKF